MAKVRKRTGALQPIRLGVQGHDIFCAQCQIEAGFEMLNRSFESLHPQG